MPAIFTNRVYLYPLIGALQGLLIYFLVEEASDDAFLLISTAMLFLTLAPNIFYLSSPAAGVARSAAFALGVATLFSGLIYWLGVNSGMPETDVGLAMPSWFISVCLSFAILAFFQTHFQRDESRSYYETLHGFAWHNLFALILSWVFVGAVWLMLFLLSAMFELINIKFLSELLKEEAFSLPLTFATNAAGLAVISRIQRVVEATHALAFALLRVLAPPFAAAVILFLCLLPLSGLTPLWETRSAAMLLLSIVAAAVLLFNAVLQDTPGKPDYPRPALLVVLLQIVVLPAFAGLAAYAMWLRIDQYGLTPERIYGGAVALVGLTGTIAYSLILLVSRLRGFDLLRQTNVYLVIPVGLIAFALITPLAEPLRLSAVSQADRLRTGKVTAADFDFGNLKFNLGKAGQEVLADLRADQSLADREVIEKKLALLDEADNYYRWSTGAQAATKRAFGEGNLKTREEMNDVLIVRPKEVELPEGFWDFVSHPEFHAINNCFAQKKSRCALIVADIFAGARPEVVLVQQGAGDKQIMFQAYEYDAKYGWQRFFDYYLWRETQAELDALWLSVEEGTYEVTQPNFQQLRFGDGFELFTPGQDTRRSYEHEKARIPRPVTQPVGAPPELPAEPLIEKSTAP